MSKAVLLWSGVVVYILQLVLSATALCQNCIKGEPVCFFPFYSSEHLQRGEGLPLVVAHRLHDNKQPTVATGVE